MKRNLSIFLFASIIFMVNGQNSEEVKPYQEGVDPEFLTDLKSRFECSVGIGYSNIINRTSNAFVSHFDNYSPKLSNGIKAELEVGYNISNQFQVKLEYAFRTSGASSVYVMQDANESESLVYIANNYYFNQLEALVQYRFRLVGERLFVVPEIGLGYLFFKNEGEYITSYLQQSSGWMFDAGIGLDYLASDIIGIGLHANYVNTVFSDANINDELDAIITSIEPDTKFSFWDISVKFLVFF